MTTFRDESGRFLPGGNPNPSGRPKMRTTISGEVISILDKSPATLRAIAEAWLESCKQPNMPALLELLNRTEGKVPSEVNMRALIINVGDDYAREGLEAIKREMLERQKRYLLDESVEETHQDAIPGALQTE